MDIPQVIILWRKLRQKWRFNLVMIDLLSPSGMAFSSDSSVDLAFDSFDRKLIVFSQWCCKITKCFNLSVATFLAYAIKSKKTAILLSSTGTYLRVDTSSFASSKFVRSCLSGFLSFSSFVRYNDTGASSYFKSFRIS